ncbi:CHAD domain-containing protein, partial [bacterium]|nr:CHAD domain-containing protein [bacterium]
RSPASAAPAPAADRGEVQRYEALDVRPVRARLAGFRDFHLELSGSSSTFHRDEAYFETADWRLYRAGYTLRFAFEDGAGEAILTAPGDDGSGRSALDVSHPSGAVESFLTGSSAPARRVRALVGTRKLQQLFVLRSHAEDFAFRQAAEHAGRIRLIETSVPVPGEEPPVRVFRVEIAAPADAPEDFRTFVKHLRQTSGLRSVAISDYEAGVLAAGLAPPGAWSFGSTVVDRTASIGTLAFAVLRDQFARVLRHEPGTRIGLDIEELHDMRVAARRMRAAFRVFAPVLPGRASGLSRELRWLGQALGDVRDLDVQIAQIAQWRRSFDDADGPVFEPIDRALHEQRERARERMLREMDSPRYEALVTAMTTFLREGADPTDPRGRALAVTAAPQLVESCFGRVLRKGRALKPSSDPARFHRVRIHAKVLRYVLEFHTGLYGDASRRMISRLRSVQNLLGRHQDADVSVQRIRSLVEEDHRFPPATVLLLGRLCERYDRDAVKLRRRFPRLLRKMDGKRWKDLRRAMTEAAGPPLSPPPGQPRSF